MELHVTWKVITLDANQLGEEKRIQDEYVARFVAARYPNDAMMYGMRDIEANRYKLFFSPSAYAIAGPILTSYVAVDCPEPEPGSYDILVTSRAR
jgi:hypothetical protein